MEIRPSPASIADHDLLDAAIRDLDEKGFIAYTGEFGAEITTFIPFVFWLKENAYLEGRTVVTYEGMRPYYYFLNDAQYSEKKGARSWLPVPSRRWPSPSTYTAVRSSWHVYPDYRKIYQNSGLSFDRPVAFIQNKFCVEWNFGPVNYLPLSGLDKILKFLSGRFSIVYSRPNLKNHLIDYVEDHNTGCDYPDKSVLDRYPEVIILEDYCLKNQIPYNLTKLQMLAKSRLMIGVQGGASHLMACFGGSLFILLHQVGEELPHAYSTGPYKYLASPPPTLVVARTPREFRQAVEILAHVRTSGARFEIGGGAADTITALRL